MLQQIKDITLGQAYTKFLKALLTHKPKTEYSIKVLVIMKINRLELTKSAVSSQEPWARILIIKNINTINIQTGTE